MFRLKYNVKLTRFISATRASFIRATFEKTMIRIEAGVLAISMRKFPRGKKKEFYIEAIDKVKMKNSRLSEIAKKNQSRSADFQNAKCLRMRFIFGSTGPFENSFCFGRRIYRWCIYGRRIRTASFGRFPSNGSLKVRFSCQFFARIILKYTNRLYSLSFNESSNYLFELKIRSNENVESYRKPYIYIYISSFPFCLFILFKNI